jgi:hypothetical protein
MSGGVCGDPMMLGLVFYSFAVTIDTAATAAPDILHKGS